MRRCLGGAMKHWARISTATIIMIICLGSRSKPNQPLSSSSQQQHFPISNAKKSSRYMNCVILALKILNCYIHIQKSWQTGKQEEGKELLQITNQQPTNGNSSQLIDNFFLVDKYVVVDCFLPVIKLLTFSTPVEYHTSMILTV